MAVVASLVANLEANVANFTSNMDKAARSVQGLKKDISLIKFDSLVNLGSRALHATERMYAFAKSIASAANDIERMSSVMGMSIKEYQQWTYAAKMADVGQDEFITGMKFLARNIEDAKRGVGEARQYFDALEIKLTDIGDVSMQIADRFKAAGNSSAEAGKKIDFAMATAGRGGMALIPMWNLGSQAVKGYMDDLVKMGGVLGDVIVKKGGEAEKKFKDIETTINASKIAFAPWALAFATGIESIINSLKTADQWIRDHPYVGRMLLGQWGQAGMALLEQQINKAFPPSKAVFGIEEGLTEPKKPLPSIGVADFKEGIKNAEEIGKAWMEAYIQGTEVTYHEWDVGKFIYDPIKNQMVLVQKLIEKTGVPISSQGPTRALEGYDLQEFVRQADLEFAKLNADAQKFSDLGEMPHWEDSLSGISSGMMVIYTATGQVVKVTKDYIDLFDKLEEKKNLIKDFGWEDWASGAETAAGGMSQLNQLTIENTKRAEEYMKAMDMKEHFLNQGIDMMIGSVMNLKNGWQGFFQSMTQGFAKLMQEIAAAIIKAQILAMIPKSWGGTAVSWFGGGGTTGPGDYGWGGYEQGFAGGGSFLTTGPTRFLAGEAGPEQVSITPKGKGGGGGIYIETYINQIEATDVNSFEKKYEGSVKKIVRNHHRKQTSWRGGI